MVHGHHESQQISSLLVAKNNVEHIWGFNISLELRNFHNIVSIYRRVISNDYSSFECVEVMLITDCLFKINCKLHLEIGKKKFPIFTFETVKNLKNHNDWHLTMSPVRSDEKDDDVTLTHQHVSPNPTPFSPINDSLPSNH